MSPAEVDRTREAPTPVPGSLLTRLPGSARSRAEAMAAFGEGVAARRRQCKPELWPLFAPQANDMYRWRVQLECGCVHEIFTRGKDDYPDKDRWQDLMTQSRLPEGEFWCHTDHGDAGPHFRDIVEWVDREVIEFPADPEEPKYEGMDAGTWAAIRHAEPHTKAFWRVKLACGHFGLNVITDVDWTPGDGPSLMSDERVAEIRQEFHDYWDETGPTGWPEEGPRRDHVRKMLDLGWPRPGPEHDCYTCRFARRITGYQRIGWLVPRPKPVAPAPADPERQKIETRLAEAEAEVSRLRRKLGQYPDEAGDA